MEPPAPAPDPPAAEINTTVPVALFTASKLQRLGNRIRVSVSCPTQTCVASVSGSISVPKLGTTRARLFKLKKVTTVITKGETATLRPELTYMARTSIRHALGRGRPITVKMTITATHAAGNSQRVTRRVHLKR